MEHSPAITALLKSQAELQKSQTALQTAMQELITRMSPDPNVTRAPSDVLTKMAAEDDIEAYLETFERTATREAWPMPEWGSILAPFLTGEAQKAGMELAAADARDYAKLKTAILARQGQSLPARAQRFHTWTYQATLPPRPQVAALRRLTHSWLLSPGEPACVDRLIIDKCIRAVPPDARKYAAHVSPNSVEELVALLENHQACAEMLKSTSKTDPPKPPGEERSGRDKRRQTLNPPPPNSTLRQNAGPERPTRRCYVCGKVDHLSWSCPDRDASMATAPSDGTKPCLYAEEERKKHTTLPVKVEGKDTHALLDSGSVVTLVRPAFAGTPGRDTVPVTCVHGDMKRYPTAHIHIQTPRGSATVVAGVVPELPVPLLLGADCPLFERYWSPADHPTRRRARRRRHRPAGRPRGAHPAYPVFRDSSADAPMNSSHSEGPGGRTSDGAPAREEEEEDPFMELPRPGEDSPAREGEFASQQWADANLEAARQQVSEMALQDGEAMPPPVPIGEELSPQQAQEVKELLGRCSDRFSELPGRTPLAEHDIDTKPGVVVRQRPYRIPESRRKAVREEVKKMLELDIIEESYSPWCSPIVIVPKPDGTLRFCNDFRKLNEVSKFDCYPMARVDELTERLGPSRFISTLDLTKGYWQIGLTERAKPKTAFSTPDGLFQYKVMPFGVHGAPATFQRLMDKVLRPHREYAASYSDDVIIHSKSWPEHLQHLEAVLDELRAANLTANAKKCRIGMTETDYLGFTVGRGCIRPQEEKVRRIKEWPRPVTKRQVKSFLGLISYYQKFIQNYSTLAAPLYDLTRQREPQHVKWTPAAEEAFMSMKEAICQKPVLISPDFNRPFLLHTDASGTGVGAVLAQVINGEEHPITFISRKLLDHERNYATVEKECLAIKWAIHHLRYYLWGRRFTLVTDHAPLKWMATNKDKNSRDSRDGGGV